MHMQQLMRPHTTPIGHGTFNGEVVDVVPDFATGGMLFRVVYNDGDQEDLNLRVRGHPTLSLLLLVLFACFW